MKVKAHLHLPRMKRGDMDCISYKPFAQTGGTEYAGTLTLTNVTFKVSEPGRQRTLSQGRKNVHAWVVGDVITCLTNQFPPTKRMQWNEARYNPRTGATFVDAKTGEPLLKAKAAYMVGAKVYYI